MSAYALKIIAIITMFIDHLGYAIYNGNTSWCNWIGRIAFPIFAFQISEGYIHTKNLKKYFLRLFLFAIISQIPFHIYTTAIYGKVLGLNVMFTLLLGLLATFIYDKTDNIFFGIVMGSVLGLIAYILHCDYGFYGVIVVLMFYMFKKTEVLTYIFFILLTFIKYLPIFITQSVTKVSPFFIMTCVSVLFIVLYNGKKGKDTKLLLYFFYPIHLFLIYGIFMILNT